LDNSEISFTNSKQNDLISLTSNNASGSGGALYLDNSQISFTNSNENALISLTNNNAGANGGAIYLDNSQIFFTNSKEGALISFSSNNASGSGGAIYLDSSQMSFIVSNENALISFDGNNASGSGGAIYAKNSQISFKADAGQIVFENNKASSKENDIYLDDENMIIFDIASGASIEIKSGIESMSNNQIVKDGAGILSLGGRVNYQGNFDVIEGILKITTTAATIRNLNINSAKYETNNSSYTITSYIGSLLMNNAVWGIGLHGIGSLTADLILTSNTIRFDELAQLEVTANGFFSRNLKGSKVVIMKTVEDIYGFEDYFTKTGLIRYDDNDDVKIEYEVKKDDTKNEIYLTMDISLDIKGLTHNEAEVQRLFNDIDGGKLGELKSGVFDIVEDHEHNKALEALRQLSGEFLANVLTLGANNNDYQKLYARMKKNSDRNYKLGRGAWAQIDMDAFTSKAERETSEFKSANSEWQAGADIWEGENYVAGLYIGQGINKLSEGLDKADIDHFEGGFYWMLRGDIFNLMGNVTYSIQHTYTQRNIEFADLHPESHFVSNVAKGGIEMDIKLFKANDWQISPFAGIQYAHIMNDEIKEKNGAMANIEVPATIYDKISAVYGVKAEIQKGKFNINAAFYAANLLRNKDIEAQMFFEESPEDGEMNIISNEMSQTYIGATIGVGLVLWNRLEIFTNADIKSAENYMQTFIQGGIKIGFGDRGGPENIPIPPRETQNKRAVQTDPLPPELEIEVEIDINDIEMQLAAQEAVSKPPPPPPPAPVTVSKAEVKVAQERRKAAIQSFKLLAATFRSGSVVLSPQAKRNIKSMTSRIKKLDYKKVTVEGHTDSTGKADANILLSRARAKAIYDEFIKAGIPREKIEYIGFGSAIPIASNTTTKGKSQNRRVEIFVE
jgi:outer membrane autotransporter protein